MSILINGRGFAFVIFVLTAVLILWLVEHAKKNEIHLKQLPAYEAIREGVGRAAELGKPVMCHCGQRNLDHPFVAATLAALSILSYVARLCAEYGVRLIVPTMLHTVYPIQVQRVREAYIELGRTDEFNEEGIRFLSPHHQAYAAGTIAIMEREQIAANIMVGQWSGITLVIAETSARLGCFGVGGTDQTSNMPFFIPTMDYAIIGEEMYSLGTYIDKDPRDTGTLFAKDLIKIFFILLIVLGIVMSFAGISLSTITGF